MNILVKALLQCGKQCIKWKLLICHCVFSQSMSLNLCFSDFHMAHVKQKISSPEAASVKMKQFPFLHSIRLPFISQVFQQVNLK